MVEPTPIILDLNALENLPDDLAELIPRIVSEIGPQHYKGKKPPDKSYETPIKGCQLYAFKWKSKE